MVTRSFSEAPDFLTPALRRLASGAAWPEFGAWFAERNAGMLMPGALARVEHAADAPAEARRAALALAREFWRLTPDPARGWQLRARLPQPGRNDPCHCGSGRKYKQCCERLTAELPPLQIDPLAMAGMLFAQGPAAWRTPEALRAMPGDTLAAAAGAWGDERGPAALVKLLEPLFRKTQGLSGRHAEAFDMLMDAMQEQGLDARRERIAQGVAQTGDRVLRCVARCRLAVLLSDRGHVDEGWSQFHAAQRDNPDDPELLHLELTLLLAQGRTQEARARAPLLAARARKLGQPQLARLLLDLAEHGMAQLSNLLPDDGLDAQEQAWVALLREPLGRLSAERFARVHTITAAGTDEGPLRIVPSPALQRRLKPWKLRFAAQPAPLTRLDGDADELLDAAEAARDWLRSEPDAAVAMTVLDDLLMAGRAMLAHSDVPALRSAAQALAFGAADMIVNACAAWPRAPLPWGDAANRPLLRIVSQAIALALDVQDRLRAAAWMQWMLARNPDDNHGWRELLRQELLREGEAGAALAVLDAYPADAPPSGHDRALALFLLGRHEEAERVLRQAHGEFPSFVAALLPEALDRPRGGDDGTVTIGGADQAWYWRGAVRSAWVESGALDWLRTLRLPRRPARKGVSPEPAAPRAARGQRRKPTGAPVAEALAALRPAYGTRLPWLLGWVAGCAWAPRLVMPTLWVSDAIEQAEGELDAPSLNVILDAMMSLYNQLNAQRLQATPQSPVPLAQSGIAPQDDAAWTAFAAGFVQFAETHGRHGWRAAGIAVDSRKGPFAPLYQLAARSAAAPGGWRASDARGQPLLALHGDEPAASELLTHAMQPLWQAALQAR